MNVIRIVMYVGGLVLVHTGITIVIGAVLLFAYAGLLFLAEVF